MVLRLTCSQNLKIFKENSKSINPATSTAADNIIYHVKL